MLAIASFPARALVSLRLLPDVLPAPLRRAPHVHDEQGLGALLPPAHVRRAGRSLPEPARLRDPASRAPRVQRHAEGPALAAHLPERVHDDVADARSATRRFATAAIEPEAALRRRHARSGRRSTASAAAGRRASLFWRLYTAFYVAFAPHWSLFLLLPVHFLMGPIHGAIVNWCGHKYGYRNFDTTATTSRATRSCSTSSRWASCSRTTTTSTA